MVVMAPPFEACEHTIQDVEAALRAAGNLTNEDARAHMGKIEYHKENFSTALAILDGVQARTIFSRIKFMSLSNKGRHSKSKSPELTLSTAELLLEAIYLKVKTLERMSRVSEAAQVCNELLETYDVVFPQGLPQALKASKIQEFLNKMLELLPGLLIKLGLHVDAAAAYRRALETSSQHLQALQLDFAVLLLYGGVEVPNFHPGGFSPSSGGFSPSNNLEEAIMLLLTIAKSSIHSKETWDPRVMEHLSFALSLSGHSSSLAELLEEVLPGIYKRTDRWYSLGLCYRAMGHNEEALELLRKVLTEVENPTDVASLLLAASICENIPEKVGDGLGYARKAVLYANGDFGYLEGKALHILGTLLGKCARNSSSSSAERSKRHHEALSSLQEAAKLESMDPNVLLDMGIENAEQGNLVAGLKCAKSALEMSSGSLSRGWRFLALVLSAQQRHAEAEMVLDAAAKEAGVADRATFLFAKAKLQASQGNLMDALQAYNLVMKLAEREVVTIVSQQQVWLEMAMVYTSLAQWSDAERCLESALSLKTEHGDTAAVLHGYGMFYLAQDKLLEAADTFNGALIIEPNRVDSKVRLGCIFARYGGKSLPLARSFLNDALRTEPKNALAWYQLGIVHEAESRFVQAADCFQASYLLELNSPVQSFE